MMIQWNDFRQCAVILALLALSSTTIPFVSAQPVLKSRPLEPMPKEDTILKHMKQHYERQNTETFPYVKQAAAAGWFQVDLKPYANVNLFSSAGRTSPVRFLHMPLGRQTFYGVPFEVIAPEANENRTALALPSKRLWPNGIPAMAKVAVDRPAKMLYVLLASYYTTAEGEQYWQLNYADGTVHRFPIVGTEDTGDWYHPHTRLYSENTHYVLIPRSETTKTAFRNMHIIQRENPHPEKTIRSITFKTDPDAQMALFIVAVTGHAGR